MRLLRNLADAARPGRAFKLAEREGRQLARATRLSNLWNVVDEVFGLTVACLLFFAIAWTISVTGPLTSSERSLIGEGYVNALTAAESSARELRLSYCRSGGDYRC